MSHDLTLVLATDNPRRSAELRLLDYAGSQLLWHRADFKQLSSKEIHCLFDLRNTLRNYVARNKHQDEMAKLGVLIAERVLGEEIFLRLWHIQTPRTLHIQLPGASGDEADLSTLLTRIPWEIARPSAGRQTLGERNLRICITHATSPQAAQPLAGGPRELVRVLFVFAEGPDSTPLAMRQERRAILRLFWQNIYPQRQIVAHTLAHGVTRARLLTQLHEHGGYHILHWSGHGKRNALELVGPKGAADWLSGAELLGLFHQAGVALPALVYLSACNSGDILPPRNWGEFFIMEDECPIKSFQEKDIDIPAQPSFGGAAHALLQGGVPSVVAMRFSVGDEYSRELALAFYKALLADAQPKSVAAALADARKAMLAAGDQNGFLPCDHATPLLYGQDQIGLAGAKGRSGAYSVHERCLPPIMELAVEPNFVGRTWELAALSACWLSEDSATRVAHITGMGGMGKTALAAEVLDLWAFRFDWVLPFQFKQHQFTLNDLFMQIHSRLDGELGCYHRHLENYPADAIYLGLSESFNGQVREQRLIRNLTRAMRDEAILLLFDGFETHLQASPEAASQSCRDPAWERLLTTLTQQLHGTRSRMLVTSTNPPAALGAGAQMLVLGPLPANEARLFLRQHPQLRALACSGREADLVLVKRLLAASRFHPHLMARLARLVATPAQRQQLEKEIHALEQNPPPDQSTSLFG